jgi:hypothetical protein
MGCSRLTGFCSTMFKWPWLQSWDRSDWFKRLADACKLSKYNSLSLLTTKFSGSLEKSNAVEKRARNARVFVTSKCERKTWFLGISTPIIFYPEDSNPTSRSTKGRFFFSFGVLQLMLPEAPQPYTLLYYPRIGLFNFLHQFRAATPPTQRKLEL